MARYVNTVYISMQVFTWIAFWGSNGVRCQEVLQDAASNVGIHMGAMGDYINCCTPLFSFTFCCPTKQQNRNNFNPSGKYFYTYTCCHSTLQYESCCPKLPDPKNTRRMVNRLPNPENTALYSNNLPNDSSSE